MSFKRSVLLVLLVLTAKCSLSQTEAGGLAEQLIESIIEDTDEEADYSELLERLSYYQDNPLNINKLNSEQLSELLFLAPRQIADILAYRETHGNFIDLLELQSIESLDAETINKLLPFIRLGDLNPLEGGNVRDLLSNGRHDLMLRYGQVLQKQQGFLISDTTRARYTGSAARLFARYRYQYRQNFFVSLNVEKDAGEGFFSAHAPGGFDFYSGSVYMRRSGVLKKLVAGDYSLQFGQGLALWSGLGFGKGAAIATITKPEPGIRPYSSANEARFLRGLAATMSFKSIELSPFVSYRKLDASINEGGNEVQSLNQSGFHRTPSEIENRHSLKELVVGLNAQFRSQKLTLGSTIFKTAFDHAFENPQQEYNKYRFTGRGLINTSLYYSRNWRNFYFFGEVAHSAGSGWAMINGLLVSLSPKVSLALLQRDYDRNYHAFYSQAVGEGGVPANERGFYSGLTFSISRSLELATYADIFRFPWLKFRVDAPSGGYELYSQLSWSYKKVLKAILRYKSEQKEQNSDSPGTTNYLEDVRKQSLRAELSFFAGKNFQLRSRVEMTAYHKGLENETGYLMYQDLIYKPLQSRFSGNLRFAIFDTDGFNSRIYAFENDVLYSYALPAVQNRGLRFYLNARYSPARTVDVWLKYSATRYLNQDEIGSGLELIKGNLKSDLKIQLRFQF